jgi:hypothetical protein
MRVPEAVQRQHEQTEALEAQLAAERGETQETPPDPNAPPETPPAPVQPAPTVDDWQHKFQTLQGKYNAEVPQLRNQVANLSQQIENLNATRTATPEPAQPVATPPPAKLVTTEDAETYGDDLIDLIRRVAVESDAGEKAKLQGEIAELRKQMAASASKVEEVAGNVTDERRAIYFTDLAKLCPTYEETDGQDAFKAWLLQPDEFSGVIRNDILQQAFRVFDAPRTAKIFNAYLGVATSEPTLTPAVPPAEPVAPGSDLASQVSPGQARASAPVTPDDGRKMWTVGEMDAFYKDVSRGDYRGRRADVERIEAEIDRALAENRVR